VTLSYTYDELGDQTSVTDSLASQGITTYTFNAAQQVTGITTSYGSTPGPQVAYGYDDAGLLTGISRSTGTDTTGNPDTHPNPDTHRLPIHAGGESRHPPIPPPIPGGIQRFTDLSTGESRNPDTHRLPAESSDSPICRRGIQTPTDLRRGDWPAQRFAALGRCSETRPIVTADVCARSLEVRRRAGCPVGRRTEVIGAYEATTLSERERHGDGC
jgi:YD repeat-containing protein